MARPAEWRLAVIALFCLSAAVFLAKAHHTTLPATDSAGNAALALSATAQGVVPHFPIGAEDHGGFWGKGFNDYSFAYYYLSGWIMRALGPDAWSAKLLPCLLSVGCVMFTLWLGSILRSRLTGLIAALILAFSRDFIIDGLNSHMDNVMAFFILASFIAWQRRAPARAGVAAGVGSWMKSPVAFLLYPSAALVSLIRRDWRSRAAPLALSFGVAVVSGFAVWAFTGFFGGWDLVRDFWVRQVWGTAIGGRGGAQARDLLLFFRVLRFNFMPWTPLLFWGVAWAARKGRWREDAFLVPACAAGVLIAAISIMRFKYGHYFVPSYPFLALIAAQPLAVLLEKWEARVFRGFAVVSLATITFLLCTPVETAPESFPALRKFAAIIQSYGDCNDRVLFVNGEFPYGAFEDYGPLLSFYAGRHAESADCAGASEAARRPEVAWVLVSGKNIEGCLDPAARARFPRAFKFGNQYLLSRVVPVGGPVDLTVLDRELKAPRDCQAAPLTRDRYN